MPLSFSKQQNNGCIVRKKIIIIVLSSQYCVIVEAAKIREKIEKIYPQNSGVSIRHSAMKQFTDLSFLCAKSILASVKYMTVLLKSKWWYYNVTMVFVADYLES